MHRLIKTLRRFCITTVIAAVATTASANNKPPQVDPVGWLDRNHLENQIERIDTLSRRHLGTPVRGNKSDLALLQRIVNRGLVQKDERLLLQAMGAVMGNVLQQELAMSWMVYEDSKGKSRALCVQGTEHCLFPITMLSRRMEVGLLPNVQEIYDYCVELMTPYLPQDAYGNQVGKVKLGEQPWSILR